MELYIQSAISGLLVGGLYAMMATGISLLWGLLKVINLAHFALILLGAYVTYQVATTAGLDPLVTVAITVPAFFVAGVLVQWVFDRFEVSEFNSLLVSFGLFIITIRVITNIWSADFRRIDVQDNPYATDSVFVGDFALQVPLLMAFLAAAALALVAWYTLTRTYFGKALRAMAHDRPIAAAYGIDARLLGLVLAGFATSTGALAGTFVALSGTLFPGLAVEWFGIIFTVVIVGGIGSLLGGLAAAFLIGVVSALTTVLWNPSMAPLVTFLILILALLFRPYGLFRRRVPE